MERFYNRASRESLCNRSPDATSCGWEVQQLYQSPPPQLVAELPYLTREESVRANVFQRVHRFMETFEFFILPGNQVLPFPITQHYPTEIAGVPMESYMAWMKSCYYISAIRQPAISVPAAFFSTNLPIGIQLVGRYHDDFGVLQLARAFEQSTKG